MVQQTSEGSFDAIIIGSGMGGIATGAFLAKGRIGAWAPLHTPGGFTHVFKRNQFPIGM